MSTKPWEETWDAGSGEELGVVWRGPRALLVMAKGSEGAASLVSAAPDMARALMAFIELAKHSDLRFTASSELIDAREALRKAGVLP